MSVELELAIIALLDEMRALREDLTKLPQVPQVQAAPLQPAQVKRCNRYALIELDLTKARTAEWVWNCEDKWKGVPALNLSILKADSDFTYAINAIGYGFMDAHRGDVIENEDIYNVFVTNEAGTGTGVIRVAGWVQK